MFSLSDLVKLLEQVPVWKKMAAMPNEIEALKRRIELLERSANRVPQGDECPRCHGLSFGLDRTEPDPTFRALGVQRHYYRCGSCGYENYKQG